MSFKSVTHRIKGWLGYYILSAPFAASPNARSRCFEGGRKITCPGLVEQHAARSTRSADMMNIVEYFQARKSEIDAELRARNSAHLREGSIDVTEQEKQRLRQTSHDYWRAAENLRRINSSQK
jgi:hypothetical protein